MKYFGQLIFIILTNLILVYANNNEYTELLSTINETPTSSSINEETTSELITTEATLTTAPLTTIIESTSISPCETTDSPVQNLKITRKEFSLFLEWTPPKLPFCRYTYKIEKFKEVQNETSDLNYIITGLKPCQRFNVSVITLYNNDPKGSVSQIVETRKIDPEAVENLELKTIQGGINITWSAPKDSGSCINKYYYEVFQDELPIWKSFTRDTYLTVLQPRPCVNYTYIIYPSTIEDQNGPKKKTRYSLFETNDPPRNASKFIYDDYVVVKWQKGNFTCGITDFYVNCTSDGSNLITHIGNINGDTFTATLTKLMPYTEYNCCGFLANKYTNSSCSKYIIILTKPKAPDSPTSIEIINSSNKYLNISWAPPKKWNGVKKGFNLTIANLGPTYEVYRRCKQAFNCTTWTKNFNALTTEFVFDTTDYSTEYKISLYANSDGGKSKIIEKKIITSEGAPEPPILVNYNLIYSEGKTYSANLTVKWKEPCKMNGEIKDYFIHFVGNRTDYDKDQEHNVTAPATDDYYKFTNLKPEYTYTVQISARNAHYRGETVDVSVITKAGGMMKEFLVVCPIQVSI